MISQTEATEIKGKIDWIIDNEGCEVADGFRGLRTFLNYAASKDDESYYLALVKDDVDDIIENIKEEEALEEDDNLRLCSDLIMGLFERGMDGAHWNSIREREDEFKDRISDIIDKHHY